MKKESLEHLSSLMDGELSRETSLFMTRRLSSDKGLSEKWERYHLARDCIRQPGSKQLVTGLQARITASLEAEAAPAVSVWNRNRWLKPVSGLAIAASVALMAIMVTAPPQGVEDVADPGLASQPFVSPNTLPMAPVSQSQAASFGSDQQLNVYLLRHNQMARTVGRQGFVSFVPFVANPGEAATSAEDEETRILEQDAATMETTEKQ